MVEIGRWRVKRIESRQSTKLNTIEADEFREILGFLHLMRPNAVIASVAVSAS